MPWSNSWSGLGALRATSLAVIGSGSEIIIDNFPGGGPGLPPGAAIRFLDLTGNGAGEADIVSQREAATNAMELFFGVQASNGISSSTIEMKSEDINITVLGTAGQQAITTMELQANTGSVIFNQSLRIINDANSGDSYIDVIGRGWQYPSLLNGWSQTTGYLKFAYRKTALRTVEFKGTIHAGTLGDSTALFNLPAAYIAPSQVLFHPATAPTGSGGGSSRIFINASGQVQIYGMTGVTDIGFDGLSFSLTD